jgi:hypothetical protein
MIITPEKRQFLKKISGGLHVLMSSSCKADEIGTHPDCPIEEIIREDFIIHSNTAANGERYWFDDGKFNNSVDFISDENLGILLKYFDDIDMYMKRVFYEACPSNSSMSDTDFKIASLIHTGELVTFEDLLNHE